jgi:nucleoside-diphosphate-sugar epimerase
MNNTVDSDDEANIYDCKNKVWIKEIPNVIDYSLYEVKELPINHVNSKTQDFSNIIESVRVCSRNRRIDNANKRKLLYFSKKYSIKKITKEYIKLSNLKK